MDPMNDTPGANMRGHDGMEVGSMGGMSQTHAQGHDMRAMDPMVERDNSMEMGTTGHHSSMNAPTGMRMMDRTQPVRDPEIEMMSTPHNATPGQIDTTTHTTNMPMGSKDMMGTSPTRVHAHVPRDTADHTNMNMATTADRAETRDLAATAADAGGETADKATPGKPTGAIPQEALRMLESGAAPLSAKMGRDPITGARLPSGSHLAKVAEAVAKGGDVQAAATEARASMEDQGDMAALQGAREGHHTEHAEGMDAARTMDNAKAMNTTNVMGTTRSMDAHTDHTARDAGLAAAGTGAAGMAMAGHAHREHDHDSEMNRTRREADKLPHSMGAHTDHAARDAHTDHTARNAGLAAAGVGAAGMAMAGHTRREHDHDSEMNRDRHEADMLHLERGMDTHDHETHHKTHETHHTDKDEMRMMGDTRAMDETKHHRAEAGAAAAGMAGVGAVMYGARHHDREMKDEKEMDKLSRGMEKTHLDTTSHGMNKEMVDTGHTMSPPSTMTADNSTFGPAGSLDAGLGTTSGMTTMDENAQRHHLGHDMALGGAGVGAGVLGATAMAHHLHHEKDERERDSFSPTGMPAMHDAGTTTGMSARTADSTLFPGPTSHTDQAVGMGMAGTTPHHATFNTSGHVAANQMTDSSMGRSPAMGMDLGGHDSMSGMGGHDSMMGKPPSDMTSRGMEPGDAVLAGMAGGASALGTGALARGGMHHSEDRVAEDELSQPHTMLAQHHQTDSMMGGNNPGTTTMGTGLEDRFGAADAMAHSDPMDPFSDPRNATPPGMHNLTGMNAETQHVDLTNPSAFTNAGTTVGVGLPGSYPEDFDNDHGPTDTGFFHTSDKINPAIQHVEHIERRFNTNM